MNIQSIEERAGAGERAEDELILCCARTSSDDEVVQRARSLLRKDLDWGYFLRTAGRHGVIPLVYSFLRRNAADCPPGEVMDSLRCHAQAVARRSEVFTGELVRLLGLFESGGLRPIPVKGPVLGADAYGDVSLREYSDLDILFDKRDVLAAEDILVAQGYALKSRRFFEGSPDGGGPGARAVTSIMEVSLNYDIALVSPDGEVHVELHWRLFPWYFSRSHDLIGPLDQPEPGSFTGVMVNKLPVDTTIIFLCLHGAKHNWTELRWVCDVAELVRSRPDIAWDSMIRRARAMGSGRSVALGLCLARDLFGSLLPRGVAEFIDRDPAVRAIAALVRRHLFCAEDRPPSPMERCLPLLGNSTTELLFQLRTKERVRDKVRYCSGLLIGLVLEVGRVGLLQSRLRYLAGLLTKGRRHAS